MRFRYGWRCDLPMDSDRRRRLMEDLGDALGAYQRGQGFLGIEHLPAELEGLGEDWFVHADALREALTRRDSHAVLRELVVILARVKEERG